MAKRKRKRKREGDVLPFISGVTTTVVGTQVVGEISPTYGAKGAKAISGITRFAPVTGTMIGAKKTLKVMKQMKPKKRKRRRR